MTVNNELIARLLADYSKPVANASGTPSRYIGFLLRILQRPRHHVLRHLHRGFVCGCHWAAC
jgi:hypothetical protein